MCKALVILVTLPMSIHHSLICKFYPFEEMIPKHINLHSFPLTYFHHLFQSSTCILHTTLIYCQTFYIATITSLPTVPKQSNKSPCQPPSNPASHCQIRCTQKALNYTQLKVLYYHTTTSSPSPHGRCTFPY